MSRSKKDGKHGGGHKGGHAGKEYWKPRGKKMMTPGRVSKDITHAMERAETRRIERKAREELSDE